MSNNLCQCKLTQEKILKLVELDAVHLGEGGVCKNKRKDGSSGDVCGMDLADHPIEGNKTLFNILIVIKLK